MKSPELLARTIFYMVLISAVPEQAKAHSAETWEVILGFRGSFCPVPSSQNPSLHCMIPKCKADPAFKLQFFLSLSIRSSKKISLLDSSVLCIRELPLGHSKKIPGLFVALSVAFLTNIKEWFGLEGTMGHLPQNQVTQRPIQSGL